MIYVYYKFHMQCVNQQKVDKKEKNCCTTAITLRRRKNQSQIYIYQTNKQTNKSFMNSYLISRFYQRLCVIQIIFDKNVVLVNPYDQLTYTQL
jgi:hypothetical protein